MPQPCPTCGVEMVEQTILVCLQTHSTAGPRVGSAVQSCPLAKGSIWVHVADDEGKGVGTVPVSHPSGGDGKPTDGSGFAPFDPLDEGSGYTVTIGPLPDTLKSKYFMPAVTSASAVPVAKGQITSVEFKLERMCDAKVTVRELDDEVFVKNISVTLTAPGGVAAVPQGTQPTPDSGIVEFKELHAAGGYQAKIALAEEDKKNYVIEGADTQTLEVKPGQPNELTFKLVPMAWVKVQLRDKEADAITDEAKRKQAQPVARVKVKKLDASLEEKPVEGPQPVEFAMKKKAGGACALEEILVEGDLCYEFVEAAES